METGAPDEQFLPRRDTELDDNELYEHAHGFADVAADHDTLEAFTKLNGLSADVKGEVIRLGLAELKNREDAGHAERLLRRLELNRRPLGRAGLRMRRISRIV